MLQDMKTTKTIQNLEAQIARIKTVLQRHGPMRPGSLSRPFRVFTPPNYWQLDCPSKAFVICRCRTAVDDFDLAAHAASLARSNENHSDTWHFRLHADHRHQ